MQLHRMDCSGRSNNVERDSDLGDDLSHGDRSDDEMRDCDSIEGDHLTRSARLNHSTAGNGSHGSHTMSYIGTGRSPDHPAEMQMSHHHHQFPPNHPLNALGNFMGIGGLHGIPNLQHNDVLEKLKMQVRDMKVGLMEQDYAAAHAAAFGANVLPTPINTAFTLPPTTMASFGHAAQSMAQTGGNGIANGNTGAQNTSATSAAPALSNGSTPGGVTVGGGGSGNGFSFTSPTAPSTKDVNPASNSSTSSDTSNSSQQNNGWSFEEQYKQVRQLYEINDDPKRKEFLDDLFSFMQKRGSPINRLPIMAKSVLDLYELYNLVIARGGLVDVINKKLWQEIIKGLHLPSSITSAAFTLRTQYMKYLYPYECEKKNLSTPAELQAAIDGNRREGRRSSYGQYEAMHNQMQMPQIARQSLPGGMQQMSPLALVTHAAAANNPQAQAAAAAAAAAHHRLMTPTFGQVPSLMTHEIEQRMMEYLKLIHVKKEQNAAAAAANAAVAAGSGGGGGGSVAGAVNIAHAQQRQSSQSPEISTRDALNALEMSRVALWQMYHNNTSPPASVNASPQGIGSSSSGGGINSNGNGAEPQRSEALNLSDSPPHPHLGAIKRERDHQASPLPNERDDFQHQPPPTKRMGTGLMPPGFPASFYLPHGMAAAAAAANFHHATHDSDADHEEEDNEEDEGEHNITGNSSTPEEQEQRERINGHNHLHHRHHHHSQQHDKSDDSAIENSPSTSAASAGNGHISPVSTKKIHLSKPPSNRDEAINTQAAIGPLETLNLLSGLQFRVTRNGTGPHGEQQLVVNLELNGIKYSGVLVANTTASNKTTASAADEKARHNAGNTNNHCDEHSQKDEMDTEVRPETNADEATAEHNIERDSTPTDGTLTQTTLTNGPCSTTALNESLLST